jgi:hypothetical protein
MHLSLETIDLLHKRAGAALERVTAQLDESEKGKGGVLRIFVFRPEDGMPGLTSIAEMWIGGGRNVENRPTYFCLSFEKALRLALHATDGHVSSAESARPDAHQYQGAVRLCVRINDISNGQEIWIIVSFSGLPAAADERLSLLVPYLMDWSVNKDDVVAVVKASGNEDFYRLL